MTTTAGAPPGPILVLGGTVEGRHLANTLVDSGFDVVTSLAGVTAGPRVPRGELVSGGFGGAEGLAAFLRTRGIAAVVDATHPYAARMSANAAAACRGTSVLLLRLDRPSWAARPDAAAWHWVDTPAAAGALARQILARETDGARTVLLAVGRTELAAYAPALAEAHVLARVADLPPGFRDGLPAGWDIWAERGPFRLDAERTLLRDRLVRVLVTKDSGGEATAAKLDAAAELGVPVVSLRRPAPVPGVATVATVADAVAWVAARAG